MPITTDSDPLHLSFPPPVESKVRHRRRVTPEERAIIAVMAAKGYTAYEIGVNIGRTGDAVISIVHTMGLRSKGLIRALRETPDRPGLAEEFTAGCR